MAHYTKAYKTRLRQAWECFIRDEDFDFSFIRPEILDSWMRSKRCGVDPHNSKSLLLNADDIARRTRLNSDLITVGRPYMERLYSIVKDSGFYLMLCDRDGVILDLIGDDDLLLAVREKSNLMVGANRSESFAGTNAIGTCLALRRPVQIRGEEHYIRAHKPYACSGGPITDAGGDIIGCLNLTGLEESTHTHTLGMVLCAVDGISKELTIKRAYQEIESISRQRNTIIAAMQSGVVLLDSRDTVIRTNATARALLGVDERIVGMNFFDVFRTNDAGVEQRFSTLTKPVSETEMNFYLRGNALPPTKLTASIDFSDDGERFTIVKLDEPKKIHRLVNKIGGFRAHFTFDDIIGSSERLQGALRLSRRAAEGGSNILILGESGVGKELFAQSVHNAGRYAGGPFVAINCGALPSGLIESELFGYEGGAFTGANRDGNPGKFELADGGTLFLDEIGDMPLHVQSSLLRVIQNREVVRIGAKYAKRIDVRIIAATNRELADMVRHKSFREDLYYRLNVITIHIPALRERASDIPQLAEHFLRAKWRGEHATLAPPTLTPEARDALLRYDWPGNIRELENLMERAVSLSDSGLVTPAHLPDGFFDAPIPGEGLPVPAPGGDIRLDRQENLLIDSALRRARGNVKKAADLLGISRRTLYRKMERLRIDASVYRANRAPLIPVFPE